VTSDDNLNVDGSVNFDGTRPRLVATDLDGTFLSPDGSVSDENRAAVLAAQRAGTYVLFVTGRPVRWLDVISDLPGAHPTVIASNGAVLYDLGEGRVLDRICLASSAALEAVDSIRTVVPDVSFAFESGTRFGYEPSYTTWAPDEGDDPAIFSGSVEEISSGEDFVKLLVQSKTVMADELLERVRTAVGDRLTATHSQVRDYGLVEVGAAGVNKGAMLARVCARLGIDARDVAAFGDMPNDVDMLTWAGRPHIVANAHARLHQLGFVTVPSNAESGVGRTIAGWLT
jgi:Cof subfamily protein (haloacid dehalogenase superfamily)